MDLLILGAGMGVVGGMLPNPLQMIALTQVALGRWGRAMFVLLVPPLVVDAAFLFVTLLFFRTIPLGIVHYVAYVGGLMLIVFAGHALWQLRRKTQEEMAKSAGIRSQEFPSRPWQRWRRRARGSIGSPSPVPSWRRGGCMATGTWSHFLPGGWWDITARRWFPRA